MRPVKRERVHLRLLVYLALIAVLIAGATWLLTIFEGLSPFEAFYLAVSTLTTLGYGDITPGTPAGRTVSMIAASSGLLLVFGLGVEIVRESLASIVAGRNRQMERLIQEAAEHHIVCGYGRLGEMIAGQFVRLGQAVVIVDVDPAAAAVAAARSLPSVQGDALVNDTLLRAGINRARSVVSTLPSDADNVYLILECRELRRDIDVITIATDAEAARRMYMAGATRVVSPHAVAAEMIAKSAVNPSVVQLMSEITDATALSENLTQIVVSAGSRLVGLQLRDLSSLDLNVKVIAVKQAEVLTLPQGGDFVITPGALLVVAGTVAQLQRMEEFSRA